MKLITGKINVKNIDKERLFEGKKGLYLDIVLIPTPSSEYSDYMIVQSTPKDEDSIILGNANQKRDQQDQVPEVDATGEPSGDGLPF